MGVLSSTTQCGESVPRTGFDTNRLDYWLVT